MVAKKRRTFIQKATNRLVESVIFSFGFVFATTLIFAGVVYAQSTWSPGSPPKAAPGTGNVVLPGETDPQVGALTSGKWCTSDGTSVNCTTAAPVSATSLTTNYVPKWNGSELVTGSIFDSGSAIGIGTASPSSVFDVVGNVSYEPFTIRANGGSVVMRATNAGNIGIGTTTPKTGSSLDVNGHILAKGVSSTGFYATDANNNWYKDNWIGMANNQGDGKQWLHIGGITDADNIRRTTYWSNIQTFIGGPIIASQIKVGIGTTTPSAPLTLKTDGTLASPKVGFLLDDEWADIRANGRLHISSGGSDKRLYLNPWSVSGDVYIGAGDASLHNLAVQGNINATGTICDKNGCIGGGSGGSGGVELKSGNGCNTCPYGSFWSKTSNFCKRKISTGQIIDHVVHTNACDNGSGTDYPWTMASY